MGAGHRNTSGGDERAGRSRPDGPATSSDDDPPRASAEQPPATIPLGAAEAGRSGPEAALATLAAILTHAPDALLLLDAHATVRLANEAAGRLWGEAPAALVGRSLAALLEAPARGWPGSSEDPPAVVETRAVRGTAEPLPVEVAAGPLGLLGQPLRLVSLRDASARLAREADLARLALTDSLTGLANRLAFEDRLQQAIHRVDRFGGLVAVHLLDLDGFKRVNDEHGHRVGDAVLVALARRLRPVVRATDTLARIGGDEFALLQTDLATIEGVPLAATRLLDVLAGPFEAAGLDLSIRGSIGAAVYPLHGERPELLWEAADQALYAAKRAGGGVVVLAGEATPSRASGIEDED
ncbi:MAG: sensor domain-containing diguanylate cyclase [Geminicoccaceae bacterium]|nr:sensor domain-containing diguanylate cyclase [Geminicoccaceae bacterium]